MSAVVFHQWLHKCCPLKRQLSQLVDLTLVFHGTPQIRVKRCQIAAPRWPNDISSAVNNAIFKNRTQNIECGFDCVPRSAVLLKPKVANILFFNFCEQKFVQHGPITIAIDCNFQRKMAQLWTKIRTKHQTVTQKCASAFQSMRAGFLCPKCDSFAYLNSRQDQNELHLKRRFFCQSLHLL